MAERPSLLIGIGQLLLGGGLAVAGYTEIKRWSDDKEKGGDRSLFGATPTYRGRVVGSSTSGLGESLGESAGRTKGALVASKIVNTKSIERSIRAIRKLAQDDSAKTQMKEIVAAILGRQCPAAGRGVKDCVPEKDWPAEHRAIWNAVVDPNSPYHMRYTRDHVRIDQFTSPLKSMTKLHIGDCDDGTSAFAALGMAAGYSAIGEVVQAKGAGTWSHIYTLLGTPPGPHAGVKQWTSFDLAMTEKGFGWRVPESMLEKDPKTGRGRRMQFQF